MIHHTDSFPGREIIVEGKNYLYFGGTSYLGLQTNIEFQNLFIQNIKKYGTNYGASRKSNVQLSVFEKTEAVLAALVHSEACTTLSSGYLAGQLLAKHFNNAEFECFYAPNSHSALFQKETTPYQSFADLLGSLKDLNQNKTPVVFLDSIDTLEASYPYFKGLEALALKDVILVVDDSHGIGIMGENGGGAYKTLKKMKPKELVVCCSLGKGFGIQAGAVFGTKSRIALLTSTDLYGGASPAAPSALATLFEANSIFEKQREKLKHNLELFLNSIQNINEFHFIQKHPSFSFKNPKLAAHLEESGILITNFKYPNNDGELMSRIVISAAHTTVDIENLTTVLNSYK